MNVFKTGPRFIRGYLETKRFTSLKKKIYELREKGDIQAEKDLIQFGQKRWVETMSPVLGLTYEVYGEENIPAPEDGPFMIYSNHQSFADICATLWLMKDHGMMGYISKEEWKKYPILPVTIDGTYHFFEEDGSWKPAHIKVTAHPLVHIEEMSREQQLEAAREIEATIRAALDK